MDIDVHELDNRTAEESRADSVTTPSGEDSGLVHQECLALAWSIAKIEGVFQCRGHCQQLVCEGTVGGWARVLLSSCNSVEYFVTDFIALLQSPDS